MPARIRSDKVYTSTFTGGDCFGEEYDVSLTTTNGKDFIAIGQDGSEFKFKKKDLNRAFKDINAAIKADKEEKQ